MKYKIGDKVVLRKDLQDGETYSGITLWEGLKGDLESEPYLEITSITDKANYETHTNYIISHSMIEGLLKPKSIKYDLIITSTNKVIILDKETGRKGMSKCRHDDKFDEKVGINLAWDRLNGVINHKNGNPLNNEVSNLEVEPQCNLPKVICVSKGEEKDLIIGKVYNRERLDDGSHIYVKGENGRVFGYYKEIFKEFTEDKKPILTEEMFKLYDSYNEELKEGDKVILINSISNKKAFDVGGEYYTITKYPAWRDEKGLFTRSIEASHNSNANNGKPIDKWVVIKVK